MCTMQKNKDITNQKFGKLTAICRSSKSTTGNMLWLFKCDCGVEKAIRRSSVVCSKTVSCGCYGRALSKERSNKKYYDQKNRVMDWKSKRVQENLERANKILEKWKK